MKTHFLTLLLIACLSQAFAQRTAPDTLRGKQGRLIVQPIVHASLVLTGSGKVIYADPTGGAAKYAGLAAPDIILVTDIHGDHLNSPTIDSIKTANTILVVPQAVADKLPEADKARAVILRNGETTVQAGINIRAIPMYNLPESPTAAHTKGRGNGYILTIAGKQVYLSGDTQGIPEMRALTGIDVAFVCMNLPYTMDINEAADAVLAFKPKIVYPYHYRGQGGFSDVKAFKGLVEAGNKGIDVRLLNWYPSTPRP